MLSLLCELAIALTPQQVHDRLEAVAPLRELRQGTHAPELEPEVYRRVATGEFAAGFGASTPDARKVVWGAKIVDVPIARMFSAINDDRNKIHYTKLDHVEIIRGAPCGSERLVFQHLPVPVLTDRWWVVAQRINVALHEASEGRVREMSWRPPPEGRPPLGDALRAIADGGTEVTDTHGGWLLVDLGDGQTLVEFWTWSDPGGVVPAGLSARFAVRSIEETMNSMADLARKGPSCSL